MDTQSRPRCWPVALGAALVLAGCAKKPTQGPPPPPEPQCLPAFGNGVPALDASGCPTSPATPDLLDEALAQFGMNRCTFTFPQDWYQAFPYTNDPYRLPYMDQIHDHPLLLPGFARKLGADLDAAASSPRPVAQSIAVAGSRLGQPLDGCDPDPELQAAADDPAPFAHAIADLIRKNGQEAFDDALAGQAQGMPLELQRALVPLVRLLSDAAQVHARYLGSYSDLTPELAKVCSLVALGKPIDIANARVRQALAELDTRVFADYAARIAMAVESADLGRFRDTTGFSFTVLTPLGSIVIRDGVSQTYSPSELGLGSNILLLVDTGGDDVYQVPVGGTVDGMPAAVAIDLGGNDLYSYVEVPNPRDGSRLPSDAEGRYKPTATTATDNGPVSLSTVPRQGAALLGVGMLFDLGSGMDHYRSLRMSQGFGALGVGVLYDEGGDDLYEIEAMGQGSGIFGIGLSIDPSGSDVRRTYYASQGFGYVRAFGALVDLSGDDQYLADVGDPTYGGDPLYWSIQVPGRSNQSFCQGAGFGRRDDTKGYYMSGGIGVLRDRDGNDVYRASVAGQGSGYWFGTGILLDSHGDDSYDELYYQQGSTAHFALAAFIDEEGNDRYNQVLMPVATGPGVGHDFGVSFLLDLGGDDQMRATNLGLGVGNDNGFGVLVNLGGNDSFSGNADVLGVANVGSYRQPYGWPTVGIFIHAGASGSYAVGGSPVNRAGTSWVGYSTGGPKDYAIGMDRGSGTVEIP